MAHFYLKITLALGLLLSLTSQSANCQYQNYNKRSGTAHIIQGAGGLANPAGSYITGGTMSRSAQAGAGLPNGSSTGACQGAGITPGVSGNNNLPAMRMGSTVGMPGDYMRSDLNPNFNYQQGTRQVQYRSQPRYIQPQIDYNKPLTYGGGQGYAHSDSNPTGRQATQVPTVINNQQGQQGQQNSNTNAARPSSSGSAQGEYKGY